MAAARALSVLGAMYVAQGLVYGFAAFVLLPTLAAAGVDLQTQAGLVALAGVPWIFKLAWGPVLDRFAPGGTRRGPAAFAFVAMLVAAAAVYAIATLPWSPGEVSSLAVAWLLLNVALSLQDVATDAMALDTLEPRQRGVANGVMLGGHHVGYEALGGLALGALVASQGLRPALIAMASLMAALGLAALAMPRAREGRRPPAAPIATLLRKLTTDRAATAVALVAAGVLFADVATSALTAEFWVNRLHWDVADVAGRLPWVLLPANVVGYVIAAAVADRIGHRKTAAAGTVAVGASWIAFALVQPWWSDETVVFAFVAAQSLALAGLYVGVHAVLMDAVDPAARATHYAVLTALLNLPRAIAPSVAVAALGVLGWAGLFVVCGLIQIAWAWALRRLPDPRELDAL